MFGKCQKCGNGLECQNEFATLKSGYWWKWRNNTHKDKYQSFIDNLLSSSPALDKEKVQYSFPLPTPYKCPREKSCKGGMDSICEDGYKGPLCSVCTKGHYKKLHQCQECPSKKLIAAQLFVITAILLIIIAACVWKAKRNGQASEVKTSLIDMFLSKIKIVIGFYQVTYGLLEAFSYIEWPESIRVISKYSEILQFNILEMAPVHCVITGLRADAFANLLSVMLINATVTVFAGVAISVCKVISLSKSILEDEQKSKKISNLKEAFYKNLFFFLYVTYLSTCSKTATVLPIACQELCEDEKEGFCLKYLKADYSIQCFDNRYNKLIIIAYISVAYIFALPTTAFIFLWRKRRAKQSLTYVDQGLSDEMMRGMQFLHENYNSASWYWEIIEMSRKVIVTSGLILVGQESRSYIGLAWVIAGMYGIMFAWNRPIQDAFDNLLMTASVGVTVFNLGVGSISKIPAENLPAAAESYVETVMFNILVLAANTLVIGLLACKKIMLLKRTLI